MDKYGEIIEAATTLFSKKGFEATGMRDIASAVRLKPGSLYAHIRSKDELLAVIIERATAAFAAQAERALAEDGRTPSERLRAFIVAHLTAIAENRQSARVYLHEWDGLAAERRSDHLAKRKRYEGRLVELLDEGVRAGDFRPVDTTLVAKVVLGLANWAYTWYVPGGGLSIEEIAGSYYDLVFSGLTTSSTVPAVDAPTAATLVPLVDLP